MGFKTLGYLWHSEHTASSPRVLAAEGRFVLVKPLTSVLYAFVSTDVTFQKERKVLNSKRLDLDACKSRLRKAKTVESQASVSKITKM